MTRGMKGYKAGSTATLFTEENGEGTVAGYTRKLGGRAILVTEGIS